MESIFKYTDYKEYLKSIIYSPQAPRGLQARLAKAAGCKAAYLNQVLKGKPLLSEDHGFRIASHLKFTPLQRDYFLDMIRLRHSSDMIYRDFLQQKLTKKQKEHLKISQNIDTPRLEMIEDLTLYYTNPYYSIIHILVHSPKYQNLDSVAKKLNLDSKMVVEMAQALQAMKVVEIEGQTIRPTLKSIHLPREASLQQTLQLQRRALAMQSIQSKKNTDDIHYSGVFTMSPADFAKLKLMIVDFISDAHRKIEESPAEEPFMLSIDAFEI